MEAMEAAVEEAEEDTVEDAEAEVMAGMVVVKEAMEEARVAMGEAREAMEVAREAMEEVVDTEATELSDEDNTVTKQNLLSRIPISNFDFDVSPLLYCPLCLNYDDMMSDDVLTCHYYYDHDLTSDE